MKTCSTCKIEKPFEDFYKHKKTKDGFQFKCKSCEKKYKEENRQHNKEYMHQYYLDNYDEFKNYRKEYYEENKEKILEQQKEYVEKNRDKISEYHKDYREENKEKLSELARLRYLENKEEILESRKQYYLGNREDFYHRVALRRARKHQATPTWLTQEQLEEIKDFYTACQMFKIYTGLTYHVDHIIPLVNPIVCGLHVPWNLQILEASENLSKHNKFIE